jgi:hypothetical protein
MTQSTAAQIQSAQAKADRRAAAAERREGGVAADNARIAEMYAKARTKAPDPGLIAVAAAPIEIQERVAEIAPLWKAQTGLDFPDVIYCGPADSFGGEENKDTWWVASQTLPAALGPMYTRKNTLCAAFKEPQFGEYRYRTAALSTVLYRLKNGLPVFA